jgi:alpha-glucosidase (family GH31 glycosyl hydrolase)
MNNNNPSFGGAGSVMNYDYSFASLSQYDVASFEGRGFAPGSQVIANASKKSEVGIADARYESTSSIRASPSKLDSGSSTAFPKAPANKAKPEDAIKHMPAVLPSLKKTKALAKNAQVKVTKQKVEPGRLFLRVPLEKDKDMTVGDFKVSVKLSMVDPETVQKIAKKLENADKYKTSNVNMNIESPKITLANIEVVHVPTLKIIWSSEPGVNFVGGAGILVSQSSDIPCQEHFLWHANIQTIDIIDHGKSDVIIRGHLSKGIYNGDLHKNSPRYALILRKHPMHSQCLNIMLQIESVDNKVEANQSHLINSNTTADDVFMGFGHRLSTPNAKGVEVRVSNSSKKGKHGYASKEMQECGAGNLVIPHFVTANGASFFLTTSEPSVFDLRHDDWYSVRVQSSILKGTWIAANSALEAMGIHASLQGRVKKMPMWSQRNGAMLGLSGGTSTVRRIHKALEKRGCPISGVVISDWTGIKPQSNRMWYNWVIERELYPNWKHLVDDLENSGVNVGLYVNPCIDEIPPHLRSGRRYIFGEAEDNGFFIKDLNSKGVYNFGNEKSYCGVVDMTNQDAVNWFKETIIGKEMLGRAGASFWIADTNFDAPIGAKYKCDPDGGRGLSVVNRFPHEFAKVNRDAIRDAGREGDSFFFVSSGFIETAQLVATSLSDRVTNLHARRDGGMMAALNGIINGGISGFAVGHCAVSMTVPGHIGQGISSRSREMICRWMEMMAFTALFRTHDGEGFVNASISAYEDDLVLDQLTRWSKVFKALSSYRQNLLSEASFQGWPVVRHPVLHYPRDRHFLEEGTSAFMLGTSLYVVPVMKPGVTKARVYLPEGAWGHMWTGLTRTVEKGDYFDVPAPVGEPPVFYSIHCPHMNNLVWGLQEEGVIVTKSRNKKSTMKLSNPFNRKDKRDF